MEKEIDSKILKDIVTKHVMFDNILSMGENILVRKNIYKTIDDYTVDGKIVFEFVNMEITMQSDYYRDYDGSLYKDKKAPFVCAFMENLMKDPEGLNLALYYVQNVTNRIMNETNIKAKTFINPDKLLQLDLNIFSQELIATSHMDVPIEFNEILINALNKFGGDINSVKGAAEFSHYISSNYGFAFLNTNQNTIKAFQKKDEIMFGEVDYNNFNEEQINEKYSDKPLVTQDNSLILISRYNMEKLISEITGVEKATDIVNNYIKMSPWVLFNVQDGEYTVKFKPNINNLSNNEKFDDYPEINPILVLRSKKLENDLQQTEKSKFKM